ncbi:hypothetical protein F5Y16DRAFT_399518 [Xylariaceae sp. FL0255]|nr:hypothetical protein F5Y16DRAFT_399518 [Xylariaceae sp. FL0255]
MSTSRPPSPKKKDPATAGSLESQLRRIPTDSSFYDFNGVPCNDNDPNSATWMYASDTRDQQKALLQQAQPPNSAYPSVYWNREKLPMSTPGSQLPQGNITRQGWMHHPLVPGSSTPYVSGSGRPGGVRSFYTDGDPNNFDVSYHVPNAAKSGKKKFAKATYHPKAKK